MDKAIIINKLIEKRIIENEKDLNEEINEYIYLLGMNYPTENIAYEILESDLLEKYSFEILNECIGLKPSGKLMDTRFKDGMSIEDIEVYCQIKKSNPELDIIKNDKYLNSINQEHLVKYNAENLAFLIEKVDILSHFWSVEEKNTSNFKPSNFRRSNERSNFSIDEIYRYNINELQLKKLKRIAKENPNFKFQIFDELFDLDEFWQLDDEVFLDILTDWKYTYEVGEQQEYLKKIIEDGKLDKWLQIRKENNFLPKDIIFLEDNILNEFSLDELKILSTSTKSYNIKKIIEKAIECGTTENVYKYIRNELNDYLKKENHRNEFDVSIIKPENYTDENINLFGIENIERFGNKILESEEYLKNYKYIKENYGQMFFWDGRSSLIDVLSDENIKKIGYENVYKYFNNNDKTYEFELEGREKFINIPEEYTQEQLDNVIEIYGNIPKFKGLYDDKILKIIRKAKENNEEINFDTNKNWLDEDIFNYIIKNGLEKNIVTILNTDFDNFCTTDSYGRKSFDFSFLKVMTPKILNEFGIENTVNVAKNKFYEVDIILEAQDKDLLKKWKNKIDGVKEDDEKEIIYSINTFFLLDNKNDDLKVNEIKIINDVLLEFKNKNLLEKIEKFIEDNPKYIRLLEIPGIFLSSNQNGLGNKWEIKESFEDIDKTYEKFQNIRNILEPNNFLTLLNSRHPLDRLNLFNLMNQSFQDGTIENWKKLLDIDNKFIPTDLSILNEGIFLNNTLEDIISINDMDWSIKEKIYSMPHIMYYVYNIHELVDMDESRVDFINEDLEEKMISILINENISPNFKESIKEVVKSNYHNKDELFNKILKFNEIANFVPTMNVVNKYPEEQIENFNKKIWFNLAKNNLYNQNDDSKAALLEAVLSFGVFEKDEGQAERLGLLQKFATYLPKEKVQLSEDEINDDLVTKHFEVIDKKVIKTNYYLNRQKLLNDPNILSLFKTKESAKKELEKLNDWYSPDYMENVLKKEYVNEQYKKVMKYIYQTGYDKVDEFEYTVQLKTDIQQLKLKNKKERTKNRK